MTISLLSIEVIMFENMTTGCNVDSALDLEKEFAPADQSSQQRNLTPTSLTFTRNSNGRYTTCGPSRIRGIPPLAIGFLDIANSGDFAANVFNHVPVPIHAIVLMAIGATVALSMSIFALRDLKSSWENIKFLRTERLCLRSMNSDKATELEINSRDLGTEIFDRAGVDIAMGFGAFLIAIGTYMAIGGANHKVFVASNLLSGYVGNALPAIYGLCNVGWSINVWVRAHKQVCAVSIHLEDGIPKSLLLVRGRRVQEHAILTAVVCLVSGALSMVTPTHWWPYPVLLVCGLAFLYSVWVYKTQLGYERPLLTYEAPLNKALLIDDICFLDLVEQVLRQDSNAWLALGLADFAIQDLLQFVIRCGLFEHLCCQLLNESCIVKQHFHAASTLTIMVSERVLLEFDQPGQIAEVTNLARLCLKRYGLKHVNIRKRYLVEALGSRLLHHTGDDKDG
jgi:hypothetical protein